MKFELEHNLGVIQTEESRINDFIRSFKTDSVELGDVRRLVNYSINLRERYGVEVLQETTERIIKSHLAQSLYLSAKFNNLPIIDGIGFVEGSKGIPNRAVQNGLYVGAESSKTQIFPDGLVSFSPFNLITNVANVIEDGVSGASQREGIRNIAKLSSHEIYHLKQRRDSSSQLDHDIEILDCEGLAAWSETQSEIEAVEFEEVFASAYIKSIGL